MSNTNQEASANHVSRRFQGTFGGATIDYEATAAMHSVKVGKKKAEFFYVSYTKVDTDPADRPLLFCFNGGPGSSTVWLNLGLFGPNRMEFDDEGFRVSSPGRLIPNEYSILDQADVVCVDAIGTGFSTAPSKKKEKYFHNFTHDIEAFSHFIVSYLNANGRWASPKFLAGESYGTLRGSGVANELFLKHGVELNGLLLISAILNYGTSATERGSWLVHPMNDLPFATYLPTYAATAWYHQALGDDQLAKPLRAFLDEVEEFALGDYWSALAKGDQLDEATRASVVDRLHEYTGIDRGYIERYNLRLHILRFVRELLREKNKTVGRIDSRYLGVGSRVADGDTMEADPSLDATGGIATATLNTYLRDELGFESDHFYKIFNLEVLDHWDYKDFKNRYVDTSEKLREVMSRNPQMKVFVANGYFDLATPHFATEYTFSHMGLAPEIRGRVRMEYYEAGHMMYVHQPSLDAMAGHMRAFIEEAV